MISRTNVFAACLFLAWTTSSSAQSLPDLVVDGFGGGDFTTIQAAVDVALPGQTIRVRHGLYDGAVIDKTVVLLGDPVREVNPGFFTAVQIDSPITVQGLDPSEVCVIADLYGDSFNRPVPPTRFILRDCDGPIFLAYNRYSGIEATNCSLLSVSEQFGGTFILRDCTTIISNVFMTRQAGDALVIDGGLMLETNGGIQLGAVAKVQRGGVLLDSFLEGAIGSINVVAESGIFEEIRDYIEVETQFEDRFEVRAHPRTDPGTSIIGAAVAVALPTLPIGTPEGPLFLDPSTARVLSVQGVPSRTDTFPLFLPQSLRPSRAFDTIGTVSNVPPPGAGLLGVPIAVQGVRIVDGVTRLTMPYIIML